MKNTLKGIVVLVLAAAASPGLSSQTNSYAAANDTNNLATSVATNSHATSYHVYSDYLRDGWTSSYSFVVVKETTTVTKVDRTRLGAVKSGTVPNFLRLNREPSILETRFHDLPNLTLLDEKDLTAIFNQKGKDGWEEFARRFPKSFGGYIKFSQVGFSDDKTQALFSVRSQAGWLAGGASLVLMEWNGKHWVTKRTVQLFVS